MSNSLKGRDLLVTTDWTKSELDQAIDLAIKFKKMGAASRSLDILKGKSVMLLFFRPSTRTRMSFTAATQELGGFVQVPAPSEIRLTLEKKATSLEASESVKDTALVIERYVDAVAIRAPAVPILDDKGIPRPGGGDAVLREYADYTKVPVINMSSCLHHPTQGIGDMMTIKEKLGEVKGKKLVVMWAYTSLLRNMTAVQEVAIIGSTYGMNVTIAYPEGYDFDPSVMSLVKRETAKSGGKLEISHDYKKALEGADIVYPRNWWSLNAYVNTKEEEQRLAARHKDWRMTDSLLRLTNNARYMHPMPFERGTEVDDSVADGPNSVIYDQAENLKHARKAVLTSVLSEGSEIEKILKR
jgi:N-acetylornithine carbamoyltransferase